MYAFTLAVTLIFGVVATLKVVSLTGSVAERRAFRAFDAIFFGGMAFWGSFCLIT